MNAVLPIARHKTAIRRNDLSLPVKCLLRDGMLRTENSFFDYGCGHGENLALLCAKGITCSGWDPVFRPAEPRKQADIVNLGYVINVIEDAIERGETLRQAWALSRKLLVVSAQVQVNGRGKSQIEFGDGVITRLGTFQKFYGQSELREYIETELGVEAVPAGIGIFYAFRDEALLQQFLAGRYRRSSFAPRQRSSERRFDENRETLDPLIAAIAELGRVPADEEYPGANVVNKQFGSLRRAFALIQRVTGIDSWNEIRRRHTEDLLVYLALARFRRRPAISKLPVRLQRDIRAFFGSYKGACEQADKLLFQAGIPDAIDEACLGSPIGKLLPNALYVHKSAMDSLAPVLRVYEGCARTYLGEVEDANIVKIHRVSGKLSYLSYPAFDFDPHPVLVRSVKFNLRTRELVCWNYHDSDNPPILHRKEAFVPKDYPLHAKFARLTLQEERHQLLDDTPTIGTRNGWQTRLVERGFSLHGHRLLRR